MGFQKVGQGPMAVKTKHNFLRISNIGRDVEAELPLGQMEIAVTVAMWSLDEGCVEGVPERTQHPLIRVDSRWEGVSHRHVIRGSWERWGGNGKDRGFRRWWGIEREVWELRAFWGAPTLKLPVFVSQALSLLPSHTLPPPAPPLLASHLLLSLFLLFPDTHACTPASSLPPFLSVPRRVLDVLLFFLKFLESSQLTKFSNIKSDKISL